jgi:hypothetical protein
MDNLDYKTTNSLVAAANQITEAQGFGSPVGHILTKTESNGSYGSKDFPLSKKIRTEVYQLLVAAERKLQEGQRAAQAYLDANKRAAAAPKGTVAALPTHISDSELKGMQTDMKSCIKHIEAAALIIYAG